MGIIFQTPIEVLDGLSVTYGASWGDLTANTLGLGILIGQLLLWDQERIHPKFSFFPTSLARLRPNVLGDNMIEQALKDYNGQTNWFAFDIKPWLREQSRFPDWLCVGYGAHNMVLQMMLKAAWLAIGPTGNSICLWMLILPESTQEVVF